MSSLAPQFVISRRTGFYGPNHQIGNQIGNQIGRWGENSVSSQTDSTKNNQLLVSRTNTGPEDKIDDELEEFSQKMMDSRNYCLQQATKRNDKVLRRLAQNREAARKSRLRKKAYVQQLESSRIKLSQLEHEIQNARQQGALLSAGSLTSIVNSVIACFEMEYTQWVEEQNRQIYELRVALQKNTSEIELQKLVEAGMNHYRHLFQIKSTAAKSDVFYVISGVWRSRAERCFLWIGGFRPSELLKLLFPKFDTLTEQQRMAVRSLQQSSHQAEDALSQGMDKLKQTLSETLAVDPLNPACVENYMTQMAASMEKLDALVSFVKQADHLRQQTLHQMDRIMNTRQTAHGLLALGDYFHRLRALSSLWDARRPS